MITGLDGQRRARLLRSVPMAIPSTASVPMTAADSTTRATAVELAPVLELALAAALDVAVAVLPLPAPPQAQEPGTTAMADQVGQRVLR